MSLGKYALISDNMNDCLYLLKSGRFSTGYESPAKGTLADSPSRRRRRGARDGASGARPLCGEVRAASGADHAGGGWRRRTALLDSNPRSGRSQGTRRGLPLAAAGSPSEARPDPLRNLPPELSRAAAASLFSARNACPGAPERDCLLRLELRRPALDHPSALPPALPPHRPRD